ncbi:MAG: class I SAM-dependent methyltransferase [Anaerolineaceae bacterium]|nr:class I SAM-dependent methyltransferase [Anaerolineaceae bacterium]
MTLSTYEPPALEIRLTLALGLTVLSPYYHAFARSLKLRGDERVLDFGSGSGICSRHIAARLKDGGHLACVDISHGWMDVVRHTLSNFTNVSYHVGRITELDLPASSFDAVVMHFVLHEIPVAERQEVVSALARLLKPGGRLMLREPQGHGFTRGDLDHLAAAAKLHPFAFSSRNIVISSVYDAEYTL